MNYLIARYHMSREISITEDVVKECLRERSL